MPSKYERTSTPGIYRRGKIYVIKQRDRTGRMHARSASTMSEAKTIQATLRADAAHGTLFVETRDRFDDYAREWVRTYAGRTSRGFRSSTREEYERSLRLHAIPFFGRMRLSDIQPPDIKAYIASCDAKGLGKHGVKNALCPVKALLATAFEDGLIRNNPSANVRAILNHADEQFDESGADVAEDQVRALTPDELSRFLDALPSKHQLFPRFLVSTGLRIGEAVELRWKDIDLAGGKLHVRRAYYRGVIGPPKTRFGVRSIPLTVELQEALRELRSRTAHAADDDFAFGSRTGTRLDAHNYRTRVIRTTASRAGLPWVSFHTLRHTFASICFRSGCNAKQVQLLLGHHAASFTLDTYVHATEDDLPAMDFLGAVMRVA